MSTAFSSPKPLASKVQRHDVPGDFYCGCKINRRGKGTPSDLESWRGYKARKNENRRQPGRSGNTRGSGPAGLSHSAHRRQRGRRAEKLQPKTLVYRKMVRAWLMHMLSAAGVLARSAAIAPASAQPAEWGGGEGQRTCKSAMKADFKDKDWKKPPARRPGASVPAPASFY